MMGTEEEKIVEEPSEEEVKEVTIKLTEDEPIVEPEEGEDSPKEGSKRWNEIYYKAKEGERKIEENEKLQKKLEDSESLMKEMREHNQKLAESMEKVSEATVKMVDEKSIESKKSLVESTLKELKGKRREAIEEQDFDTIEDLTDEIYEVKQQLKGITEEKLPKEEKKVPENDLGFDPTPYESFIKESPWFNEDPIMRASAIEVDRILTSDPIWGKKSDSERLGEVKIRVEGRFGIKSKKIGGVEGASSVKEGTKVVKLSETELKVARGLGITPEEYAKQKSY